MPTPESRYLWAMAALLTLPLVSGCRQATASDPMAPSVLPNATNIVISDRALHTGQHRLGINLSGQAFYDSGQILRNLTFRNPGFEGGTWQSILRCKVVTADTCTDDNEYTVWPADFTKGAHYEVLNKQGGGTVLSQTVAENHHGVVLTLQAQGAPLAANDFIVLRLSKPGHAEAGWWPSLQNGATLDTEYHDLAPNTLGKQALRINAAGTGQSANVISYFDSFEGRSFVHLRGLYTLRFRAKGLSPGASVDLKVERLDTTHGARTFLTRNQPLASSWHDYEYTFDAQEMSSAFGTVGLTFHFDHTSALLDDVSLTEAAAPDNPTPFRNAVVQTLRDLHPGVLRYMDSGGNFGSSIDNMLTPVFGRERAGASTQEQLHEDIPMGLHEFLVLSKAVGAEPWYAMPPGISPTESAALIEYLAGPADSPFGRRRAALGQVKPWTEVFPAVHLELGNEEWNHGSFAGSTIHDPTEYGKRTSAIFGAMRTAKYFAPQSFDLIQGGWTAVPWWTQKQLASTTGADTVALGPYLFTEFKDASSEEAVFGPMLAQPQQQDGPGGIMAQQAAAAKGLHLAVYEVNLGILTGSVTQAQIDGAAPSLGSGLAVIEHMLLMQRDLNIDDQCLFALPQYINRFTATDGSKRTMPLWGAVIDMGGQTNLRRPTFLAEQLANTAILPTQLATTHSAPDPGWKQAKSANDSIELANAKSIETFAYTDGHHYSLILLNLSRTDALSLTISGNHRPAGPVREQRLNALNLSDSNEHEEEVRISHKTVTLDPAHAYLVPAHSMTVLTW